jgi:DNA replication protein DnaC
MLTEVHFDLFRQFRIKAMGDKCREMVDDPAYDGLTFEERMEVLLDAEATARRDRKVAKLVREAKFKDPSACVEDVLYLPERKLSKDRVLRWAECRWVEECEVMVVISKSGCGKSFLVQALGNAACRRLIPTRYARLAGICEDLNRARASDDGSYFQVMDHYKGVQLLIVDDFMTTPVATQNAVDLFEIMEAREGRRSTLIASQLEPNEWYLRIEGELMADSILNRIATAARYVDLTGPNMRRHLAEQKGKDL